MPIELLIDRLMGRVLQIVTVPLLAVFLVSACTIERPIEPRDDGAKIKGDHDQLPERQPLPAPKPTRVERKLLLFGLDGADWRLIDPLLEAGRLPNLQRLIAHGTRAPLKTFKPCLSPLIWTTIATGVGPLVHGISGFTAKLPDGGQEVLVTSNLRRVEALWSVASKHDHSAGVIGWWATFPAEEIDGFVISDQASTLRRENYRAALELENTNSDQQLPTTWPVELATALKEPLTLSARAEPELLDRFLKLDAKTKRKLLKGAEVDVENILSIFKFALLIDRSFIESGLVAAKQRQPNLTLLYLNGLDAAEHHFCKYTAPDKFAGVPADELKRYGKVIDEYYVYMDEVLGRYLALYDADELTVVIVSDHGHEANRDYDPKSKDHFDRVCSGTHDEAPDGVIVISGKDVRQGVAL
ncbi:MAG: alkaline phosphatase family protein, partial [Deltaproteobacteria bacterium]|nr:alkaline phosphatase family protein [Deltaproteobacteria bacterium]